VTGGFRVFLDSNVLISALAGSADSAPVVLLDWLAGGRLGPLLTSRWNVVEVERNLRSKLAGALPLWREFLDRSGIQVVTCRVRQCAGIKAKDSPIVAAAIRSRATHFVTGDKRLLAELRATGIKNVVAVTPREMLDILLQTGGP
jgi:predicted nucleic acid-binding protein